MAFAELHGIPGRMSRKQYGGICKLKERGGSQSVGGGDEQSNTASSLAAESHA